MPERSVPSVRTRQLARDLRRIREAAGVTGEAAAAQLGWSGAKISRIENARTLITVADLRKLIELYGVTGAESERLVDLARTARQRGWWAMYAETLRPEQATYIGLESEATAIHSYDVLIFAGLVQTERYMRALFNVAGNQISPGEVERRVQIRLTRQQRIYGVNGPPINLVAIFDESVIRHNVGGPDVMREQLLHVLELSDLPNITLGVLPYSVGAHLGMAGAFKIFQFPHYMDPEVVYTEQFNSELLIEDERYAYEYSLAFNDVRSKALGQESSIAFIRQIAENL
jgi:transcriptional regulator with XRE-family HTH domain